MRNGKLKVENGKLKMGKNTFLLFFYILVLQNQYAQSNQVIYTQFIQQLATQEGSHFLSYNGYAKNIDSLYFQNDSLAENRLIPQKWEINYRFLAKKKYLRQLSLQMRIQKKDTFSLFETTYQDTLSKAQVKTLLRSEKADFQGKTPFWQDVYIKPAAIIISSVALVLTLFYVRSQ